MPQFTTYEEKSFKVSKARIKVDDLRNDNPEVEQVILELPGDNPDRITSKPRKTVKKTQKIEQDGVVMDQETEEDVAYTRSELIQDQRTEIFGELSNALQDQERVEIQATVTKGVFDNSDGSSSTHYFIRNDDIETIELSEKSTAEEFADKEVQDDEDEEIVDGSDDKDVLFGDNDE